MAVIQPAAATSHGTSEGTGSPVSQEVGAYIYLKVDPAKPAAWENSGPQRLLVTTKGTDWFEDLFSLLPADVCGPGWAIQQDKLDISGNFSWPQTITYPNGFTAPATLTANRHDNLEVYGQVPECAPEPSGPPTSPPAVTPTPEPTPAPTPNATPTPGPTSTPNATPTPVPTPTPSPTATQVPTPEPTSTSASTPGPTSNVPSDAPTAHVPAAPAARPVGTVVSRLPDTGARPALAALAGAGVLTAGLGAAALIRNRRRHEAPND